MKLAYRESSGAHVYFVKDNGVGLIWHMPTNSSVCFQRLHPTEEFDGTGWAWRLYSALSIVMAGASGPRPPDARAHIFLYP